MVRVSEMVRESALRTLASNKNFYKVNEGLKEGQVVFRKRMSFARHCNMKLQKKILEAYCVLARVGTGMYRLRNVVTNAIIVLPVDQLITTRLSVDEVIEMLVEINN